MECDRQRIVLINKSIHCTCYTVYVSTVDFNCNEEESGWNGAKIKQIHFRKLKKFYEFIKNWWPVQQQRREIGLIDCIGQASIASACMPYGPYRFCLSVNIVSSLTPSFVFIVRMYIRNNILTLCMDEKFASAIIANGAEFFRCNWA